MRDIAPMTYRGVDGSLLVAALVIGVLYTILDRVLTEVENARRRGALKARVTAETASRAARPAAPATRTSGGTYKAEALLVLDIVNSTILVTRFGNCSCRSQQRSERLVSPVSVAQRRLRRTPRQPDHLPVGTQASNGGARSTRAAAAGCRGGDHPASRMGLRRGDRGPRLDGPGARSKTFRLQSGPKDLVPARRHHARSSREEPVVVSEVRPSREYPDVACRFLGLAGRISGIHRLYRLEWRDPAPPDALAPRLARSTRAAGWGGCPGARGSAHGLPRPWCLRTVPERRHAAGNERRGGPC
jgi:hypothetical protein